MSEVLSQSEIDDLLKALTGGDLQEDNSNSGDTHQKIKEYDFRTANKFTKEQIKTIGNIYSNFAQLFSTYLSGLLRTVCKLEVSSVEEITYAEYINGMLPPVIMAIVDMPPMEGETMIGLSATVAYSLIDRVLGGKGKSLETDKEFTDIEIALVSKNLQYMIKPLNDAWSRVLSLKTYIKRIETNPQFVQIVPHNEPVVLVTINATIDEDIEGFINICIPYLALQSIDKKMEKSMWASSKKADKNPDSIDYIKHRMSSTKVDVCARFNPMNISLRDFAVLERGDVLKLDHGVNEDLNVYVCNKKKFSAKLGVYDKKYALKLTNILSEEESTDD